MVSGVSPDSVVDLAPPRPTGGIYIGLGSNIGDRELHLRGALRDLAAHGEITVIRCSALFENDAVGGPPDQDRYLNAVAEIDTELPPATLLNRLHAIETRHGRVRTEPNAPRTLDLDLLLYRDEVVSEPDLVIPHPRMWEREFVLRPLAEICDAAAFRALRLARA